MHKHTEYVDGCFGCKLKSLNWGIVPGDSYYDKDSLEAAGLNLSKEEVLDMQHDYRNAPVHEVKLDDEGKPRNESQARTGS